MITDLISLAKAAAADAGAPTHDRRFKLWVKRIDKVDQKGNSGYAFHGPFVRDGDVEINEQGTLYLIATAAGSMKYHTTTYTVLRWTGSTFEFTGISTTDKTPGWALRIRDQVIAELNKGKADQGGDDIRSKAIAKLSTFDWNKLSDEALFGIYDQVAGL